MATRVNITAKWIQSVEIPNSDRVYYADETLRQLYLCVTKTGAKIWQRYGRVNGRMTRVRIGTYPSITVKAARELCQNLNAQIANGQEVSTKRRVSKGGVTLGEVYDWYIEYHAKVVKRTWKKDKAMWESTFLPWKNIPIEAISRQMIVELFTKVTNQRGPGAANKALALIRILFNTAIKNGQAARNPVLSIKEHQPGERDRFLQPEELPAFFSALQTFSQRIQDFVMLAIFTGARRSNVMAMKKADISLTHRTWTIPRTESKSKRPVVLPLADQAFEIIQRRFNETGNSPFIFPSYGSTGHYVEPKDAWKRLVLKSGLKNLNLHDLRRTLGSWLAGNSISMQIIAKSLGQSSLTATPIYARLANEPVRNAVQDAINSMQTVLGEKKSEKFWKSFSVRDQYGFEQVVEYGVVFLIATFGLKPR